MAANEMTYMLRIDERDQYLKAKFARDAGRLMAARQVALIQSNPNRCVPRDRPGVDCGRCGRRQFFSHKCVDGEMVRGAIDGLVG